MTGNDLQPLFAYGSLRATTTPPATERIPLAVIDLETTGRYAPPHRICEIGIVRVEPTGSMSAFTTLVNPERRIETEFVHHITNGDVLAAPTFADVAGHVLRLLDHALVVAHFASFEEQFLAYEFARAGIHVPLVPTLCTHRLARRLLPDLPHHDLDLVCDALGIPLTDRHTALGDARATTHVAIKLLNIARTHGLDIAYPTAPAALPTLAAEPPIARALSTHAELGR